VLVAIVADTHLPRGGRKLPEACVERLKAADLTVHAGDLTALGVLEQLRGYGEVLGVHGNRDEATVCAALPAQLEFDLDGRTIAVVHDGGRRAGRLERLRRKFARAEAVIFGHSHVPLHQMSPDGFQIFNPGSPTERRRAPRHTMGMAFSDGSRLRFELIELD
jgi:putative phosphoesterase